MTTNEGRTFYCGEGFNARRHRCVPLRTGCCNWRTVVRGGDNEKGEHAIVKCGCCGVLLGYYITPSGVKVRV